MAMTGKQFLKYIHEHRAEIDQRLYEQADRDVNGDPNYFKKMGEEIDKHPIHHPGVVGPMPVCIDDLVK